MPKRTNQRVSTSTSQQLHNCRLSRFIINLIFANKKAHLDLIDLRGRILSPRFHLMFAANSH